MTDITCILVGIIAITGGLSGTIVLKGTHSSLAYAAAGVVMLLVGAVRVARRRP
jgi:hypothetical protein